MCQNSSSCALQFVYFIVCISIEKNEKKFSRQEWESIKPGLSAGPFQVADPCVTAQVVCP